MINVFWLRVVAAGFVVAMVLGAATAKAGPAEDLENRKREYDNLKSSVENASNKVNDFLDSSRRLRELDRTELDELIARICEGDIEPNEDEERRLVEALRDNVVTRVSASYNDAFQAGEREDKALAKVLNDIDSLIKNIQLLTSIDEVKSDATSLLKDGNSLLERANHLKTKLYDDYKSLTNVANGAMKGSNNPRIRAAMEYGQERHTYNQRMCESPFEKEVEISGGRRADCVTFLKDNCAVWEFKPDTKFNNESAAAWARDKYLSGITEKFKTDERAIANCKKDSNNNPTFEAKGAVYPGCRPSSFAQ